MSRIATSPSLSFLLFVLSLSLPALVAAQQIYRDSNIFAYQGCITETTDIANSSNPRALSGSSLVDEEAMTVPMCLEFCSSGGESGERPYRYAGLQYSRYVCVSFLFKEYINKICIYLSPIVFVCLFVCFLHNCSRFSQPPERKKHHVNSTPENVGAASSSRT